MPKITIYKYNESDFFHFFNANPKGKNASDCVYRAISVALEQEYALTMREMTEFALSKGYAPNEDKLVRLYLESKGWETCKEPRNKDNKKISVKQFLKTSLVIHGSDVLVAKVGSHHVTLIKESKVWDTWDCSSNTLHTYWRKKR